MNRTLYNDGVEVHKTHLEYTESSKIDDILTRSGYVAKHGIVSGFAVTVNGVANTKIDIAVGKGYTPNGEYVELASGQVGVSLASYTVGVKNYVLLVYDELTTNPESHETDGTVKNTRAVASPRLVVLSEAAYTALPQSDATLSSNAKDRALVLAIVTANGSGVGLTSGSIQGPTVFDSAISSTQPANIGAGIVIIAVDPTTPLGSGTLSYTASTKEVTWRAPGEGSAGPAIALTSSEVKTLTSSGGKTLLVRISYSLLPAVDLSDSIVITDIYSQQVDRFSAVDAQHRSMLGSGQPTQNNPHAMTLDDLSPGAAGTVETHQDMMHSNGIWANSSAALLSAVVNTVDAPDTLQFTNFVNGDVVFVNGKMIQLLNSSTSMSFGDGTAEPALYSVYLTQDGVLFKQVRAKFPATGVSLLYTKAQIVNVSSNVGTASKNLTHKTDGTWQFDGGQSKSSLSAVDNVVRLYAADRVSWIDVYIKGGVAAPGINQTDAIQFTAEADPEIYFMLCYVPWSGSATGFLGAGFGAANSPNAITDKRTFGTLASIDLNSGMKYTSPSKIVTDIMGDGIAFYSTTDNKDKNTDVVGAFDTTQFNLGTVSTLSATVEGGTAYVGGIRFDIAQTVLTLIDNAANRIYIDDTGIVRVTDKTADQLVSDRRGKPYITIWTVTLAAGAETARQDLRARYYMTLRKDRAYGVVGLDANKAAAVASSGAKALDVSITSGNGAGASFTAGTAAAGTHMVGGDAVTATAGDGSDDGAGAIATGGRGVVAAGGYGGTGGDAIHATGGNSADISTAGGRGGYFVGGDAEIGGTGVHAKPGVGSVTAGYAIESEGNIKFSGATPASTTAYANTQTPSNILKAWANISTNGPSAATINAGFNIASVAPQGQYLRVTFAQPFASSSYVVMVTICNSLFRAYSTGASGTAGLEQTSTYATIHVTNLSGSTLDMSTRVGDEIQLMVVGLQ